MRPPALLRFSLATALMALATALASAPGAQPVIETTTAQTAALAPPIPVRSLELVLPRALVGGREVSTARFTADGDAPRVAAAIAAAWRLAGNRDIVRRDSGPWLIVSRVLGSGTETVQLRQSGAGATAGLISRWAFHPQLVSVAHHPRDFLPDDATWIDQLLSRDGDRVTVSAVALVDRGVAALAGEIGNRARARGFVRDPVVAARPGDEIDISIFRKTASRVRATGATAAAELVVTLERRGDRTAAVFHLSEEPSR